jgi:hypothetical protein
MGQLAKGLLLVAVVVPVTAFVTSSLASPSGPQPTDHSPVILRDAPLSDTASPDDAGRTSSPDPTRTPTPSGPEPTKDRPAEVVTPQPTPIGEDDDDEWDDDPDDDDLEDDDTETERDDD